MKKFAVLVFIASFAVSMNMAWGQKVKVKVIQGKDKVIYKKNQTINFEDTAVDGELIKPTGNYFQARGRAKFNSLIVYRSNFLKEMIKSAKKL